MSFIIFLPLLLLAICFIIRAPIGYSMIAVAIFFLIVTGRDIGIVAGVVTGGIYSNSVVVAIPLFIFTANIMNSSKVTEYMFTFVKALIGKKRGAMAYINIVVSLIFSGMSGSAIADAAGMGGIEISEMKKDGYDAPFSAAITAATATVGPIFPPSIPMVMYAMIAQVSVGSLFAGGAIPALLICFILGVYVYFISKKRKYPYGIKYTPKEFFRYALKAFPALLTPIILLGGIYSGIVTPTEAGALAALWATFISVVLYRTTNLKSFIIALKDTIIQTGIVMAIVVATYAMSYYVTSSNLSSIVTDWFFGITNSKYLFLLLINILFLFLGMLFDTNVLILVFLPLVLPVASALGINIIHFGVVIVVNMMLGCSTPPYGILCFVVSGLTGESLRNIYKETLPMTAMMLIVLLAITFIPELVLAIPNLIMN